MKSKSIVKSNVEKAISKGIPANEILEYMEAEGYAYDDLASTSDKISGYMMKGLQGITLGHADEIGGFVSSLLSDNSYQQERDRIRTAEKLFDANNPKSSFAAEMAGGLGTGLLGVGGKANTLWNMTKAGGVMGGVAGHGYSESDDLIGKAADVGLGTATGAGFGLAAKPAIDLTLGAAKTALKPLTKAIKNQHPSKAYAALLRDIQSDGADVDDVLKRMDELGDYSIIPDAAGGNVKALAKHVAETPGKGVDAAEKFLTQRDLGQGQRLSDFAAKLMGKTRNYYDELDDLFIQRQKDSAVLYKQYVDDAGNVVDSDDLMKLLEDEPYLAKAFEKAAKDPLLKLKGFGPNSIRFIDTVKKDLQGKADTFTRAGNKFKAGNVTDLKNKLVAMADESTPGYAAARAAYKKPSDQMDMMALGRDFMKGDTELVAKQVKDMPEDMKEYFLVGVIRQIDDTMRNAPINADMTKRIFGSKKKQDAIRAAFGDDEKFKAFEKAISAEAIMNKTKQGVLGGSPTYKNIAKADQARGDVGELLSSIAQQNPVDMGRTFTRAALRNLNQGFNQNELSTLSDLMFTSNKDLLKQGLKRELLKRQGLLGVGDVTKQTLGGGLLGYQATQMQPLLQEYLLRQ